MTRARNRGWLVVVALVAAALVTWLVVRWSDSQPELDSNAAVLDAPQDDSWSDDEFDSGLTPANADRTALASDDAPILPPTSRDLQARALSFEIEVVDSKGEPAPGVALYLGSDDPFEPQIGWRGTSDAHGRARVSRAFLRQRLLRDGLVVAPTLARAVPQEASFTLTAPPSSPVRFQLAPAGSIELVVTGLDGQPLASEVEFSLRISSRVNGVLPQPRLPVFERLRAKDGKLVVEPVGLDFDYWVVAGSPRLAVEAKTFQGPHQAGERVRVELRGRGVHSRCRGRLVDASLRPLSRARVTAYSAFVAANEARHVGATWFTATTDTDGRFDVGERFKLNSDHVEIRAAAGGREVGRAFFAVPPSTQPTEPGEPRVVDLGEVVITPEPMFATGRVVDDEGQPVSGVGIQLRAAGDAEWRFVNITSDENGRFAIPTRVCDRPAELRALRWRLSSGPAVSVEVCASDVVLSISSVGWIEGQLLLPDNTWSGELELRVERIGADGTTSNETPISNLDARGYFQIRQLPPGDWNVRVVREGRVLIERLRVPVRANEFTSLGMIDLREQLFVLHLTLRTATNERFDDVSAIVFGDDRHDECTVGFRSDGSSQFVSLTPTRAVLIQSLKYQCVFLPNAGDGTVVTLVPQFTRTFEWPADLPLLPEEFNADILLRYVAPEFLAPFGGTLGFSGRFDTAQEWRLPFAGRYEATITVEDANLEKRYELARPGALIVVGEQPSSAPYALPIDPDLLAQFLREHP